MPTDLNGEGARVERKFPSGAGIFVGVMVLIMSIIAQPEHPSWVMVRTVLIVASSLFTAANVTGILLARRRHGLADVENKEPT